MHASVSNLIILIFICSAASKKLMFVQEIFRHGARYPLRHLENDLTQFMSRERVFAGELTSQGKHMHYLLGQIIYDKYWKQLWGGTEYQHKYHPSQIYVRSTNVNRTIESAQSQLLGLLQKLPSIQLSMQKPRFSLPPYIKAMNYHFPSQDQTVKLFGQLNNNFHTIPIHMDKQTIPLSSNYPYRATPYDEGDFLIKFEDENCPQKKRWTQQNLNSQEYKFIVNSDPVKQFLSNLSNVVGKYVSFDEAFMYIDDYQCELFENRPYLDLYKSQKTVRVADFIMITSLILKVCYNEIQIKSATTRLIQNTIRNMRDAINGSGPKMVLYSAHDTTILAFSAAFKLLSVKCIADNFYGNIHNQDICISQYPPFASNILLELWEEDDSSYQVQILYNGVKRQIPICGNKFKCPFLQLNDWAKQFYIDDPNQVCGIHKHEQFQSLMVIGLLCVILIMSIMYLIYWRFKKDLQQKMEQIQQVTRLKQMDDKVFKQRQ